MSPMRLAILTCSSSVSWEAALVTFGEGWYKGIDSSYDGGGPRDIPDEDEVCSCKSDDERDSREAGGVSLPLSKDKSSAADDSPCRQFPIPGWLVAQGSAEL